MQRSAMEYRFNAEEWAGLSGQERARRCRLMADEAVKLASFAAVELKDKYLGIAKEWEHLAREIERGKQ